jgi:hypothetical protein
MAAWISAGSPGLMAHPLRHALTIVLMVFGALPGAAMTRWSFRNILRWFAGVIVASAMVASPQPVINVLAGVFSLAGLSLLYPSGTARQLRITAWSILLFALYRFALGAIPWCWWVVDRLSAGVSGTAGFFGFTKLSTGATFAGLDFIVLTSLLAVGRLSRISRPLGRGAWATFGVVLGGHLLYLELLASFPKWIHWFTKEAAAAAPGAHPTGGLRDAVVWYLPVVGLLIHTGIVAWLIRRLPTDASQAADATGVTLPFFPRAVASGRSRLLFLACLAWAVPALALLNPTRLSLEGKKIVVHEKGFLNWLKPKHGDYGRLSVGMYGMLPRCLESFGASCVVSPDLSDADLADAQLLMLIFPNKPWQPGQLERIWRFVHQGGSLLVLGEHTVREKDGGSRFNEVLEPTAMRVGFDSAMFAIGGWLQSYEALAHPASLGMRDDRNQFGVVIGASVEMNWPARPLLVGRWGWADPGDATNDESKGGSMMGNQHYDAGERLGDVLLAAEQKLGRGRVVVFGDTSGFTNGILFGSYEYASALFASLCNPPRFGTGRAALSFLALSVLIMGIWRPPASRLTMLLALSVAGSIAASTAWSRRSATLLPTGAQQTPNMLAYIDAAHHSLVSGESWRINGLGGLELTLMRNGYHVLSLGDFTLERLRRAGLLISPAPGQPFTRGEREALRTFIEQGGNFVCTVGYPESAASREMLAELGFFVGGIGAATGVGPEPKPFGHFKAPYHNGGDYMAHVRFHAGWVVESSDSQAQPMAYGPRDPRAGPNQTDPPVILVRRIGRGKAVVIADTQFATNQNLENEGGQPFEGMRENSDFWRWLITYLNDQPLWAPPKPAPATNNVAAPPDPDATPQ